MVDPKTALVTGASALVSGATGFLGGHLAALLVAKGYQVRALARTTSDLGKLTALGVEVVPGDLGDRESLCRAAAGQRLVFHTAGKVADWGPPDAFFQANEIGVANMIAACQQAGVERLIHTSSLTVLGLPRHGKLIDESSPYGTDVRDPYSVSKIAGEKLMRAAHGHMGLGVTIVRPGVIWGPGDITIIPRFAALLRRGRMVLTNGGRNLIALSHVDNLATGMLLAAETEAAAGEIYHITDGEELTARTALHALAEALGTQPPHRSLPFWALYAVGATLEGVATICGRTKPPAITRYGVRLASCHCRYDLHKAQRELGYIPHVTFREGIRALAQDPSFGRGATVHPGESSHGQ